MAQDEIQSLVAGVRNGRLSRREFVKRAAVLGVSGSAIAAFLSACGAAATATAFGPTVQAGAGAAATAVAPTVAAAATTVAGTGAAPTVAAAATTVAGGAATPVASGGGAGGNIKIYSSFPRTGSDKGQSDGCVNSIKMALEEVNYKVGNFTIVYGASEDLDDGSPAKAGKWDGAVEAANANKAVADPDCMVYIGTLNSGAAKVSIPILNPANLAMISPANTYPGLTQKDGAEANEPDVYYPNGKRNYMRVVANDALQGAVGASYAKELGAKKVYVIDDTELYGHGIAVVFVNQAKKLGFETVGPEGTDREATDYRALATKIKSSGADMVYFGGVTPNNAGKIWKDLRAVLGKDFKIMGPDGIFEEAFITAAGDAAEGTYATFGGLPPEKLTGKGADFVKKYKEKYKVDASSYAAYSYELTTVILDALKRAGKKDRVAIRDAMLTTKDWDGVLGKWSFTANGDTTLTAMTVNQVKNNKFEYIKTVEAK